jgi:hypothetical protein
LNKRTAVVFCNIVRQLEAVGARMQRCRCVLEARIDAEGRFVVFL